VREIRPAAALCFAQAVQALVNPAVPPEQVLAQAPVSAQGVDSAQLSSR
jgi:hypothetical protein